MPPIDDDFSSVWKIDRDLAGDVGLHLPGSPIGLIGVFHQHSRFQ